MDKRNFDTSHGPEEFLGDVLSDLNGRRGQISGTPQRDDTKIVHANVPLVEMFGYATAIRSLTQGRGLHEREFSHYEEVPKESADKVIAEAQAAKVEG